MQVTHVDGTVLEFTPEPGRDKLRANTEIDADTTIHTSCSKPIAIGDVHGPWKITALVEIFE